MNKGYIIFNKNFTENQLNELKNCELYDVSFKLFNQHTIDLLNCPDKHYDTISKVGELLLKNYNNENFIEYSFSKEGIILILYDLYTYKNWNKKIVELQLPKNLEMLNMDEIQTLKELIKDWKNFHKIYLCTELPNNLQEKMKYNCTPDNIDKNLNIINEYIKMGEKTLRKKL